MKKCEMEKNSYEKIYEVVKQIPKGCVATYGQVAALAGNTPLLEIEFSSIGTTDIKFQLKDFVSEEMDLETVQESKTLEELGWEVFYFLGYSLRINFDIYKDMEGNVYIAGDQSRNNFGCYKVEDEGFKELLIEICSEDEF